jgi:hypothetical protein
MEQTVMDRALAAAGNGESVPAATNSGPRPEKRVKVSSRFLLALYLFLPLCLLIMILDRFVWNGSLLRALPTSPQSFFFFQLIFGTPHILASSVILFTNGNYLHAYWPRLLLFTAVILVFFGVGSLFIPYEGFLAVVGAATVLHVIKQQVGIGKGLCRLASPVYDAWGWTLIVFGSILYFAVYVSPQFTPVQAAWVHGSLWVLGTLAFFLTLACHWLIKTTLGRLYLWGNAVMVLQSALFYSQGYPFLTILGPRLVHDVTAFAFYVAHDVNRHAEQPRNFLYRWASKLGLGIAWVCPVVALLLTFLIGQCIDPLADALVPRILGYDIDYAVSFLIVGYLGLLHYYTEAFTWRKGSPYREHFAISA